MDKSVIVKKLIYGELSKSTEDNHKIINGEMKEMFPTSFELGEYKLNIGIFLKRNLGKVGYTAVGEVGILISKNPLKIRSVDLVYISKSKIKSKPKGILEIPPDLVIEIISPSNTFSETEEKIDDLLKLGTEKIILIDPHNEKIFIHQYNSQNIKVHSFNDKFELIEGIETSMNEMAEGLW